MSNPIGFDKLFNVKTFDEGTSKIVDYLKRITAEIALAEGAADRFASAIGKQLKDDITKLSSSSKTLSKDMQDMSKKMNDFKATTSNTKKVLSDYERENEKLRKKLEKLKTAQSNVGKETKKAGISFKGAAQAMLGLASGAALVYTGIRILKEQLVLAVKSTIEFEKAMKEVQAISRASAEQLALLTENANRLGATTEKTATEIAKLQKELGKLGFNTTEILASTDAIVDLATATGEDLAQSATVAAATLRAFGLEAVEMNRVVDVMAGSFVRSGLDLQKFRESMKLVAPIARATNISVEATTASLSKLADAGLSGSLAGTALRNLFSEMADPTSKLVKYLGGLNEEFVDGVNSSEEMIRAFKGLRDSGVDLAKAVQMVDVRARPAFFTIMNQIDAVEGLTLQYTVLDGEASDLADTMRDTLSNDIKIANSAFDALRRNVVEEFNPAMRGTVQVLTMLSETLRFGVSDAVDDLKEDAEDVGEKGLLYSIFFGNSGSSDLANFIDGVKNSLAEFFIEWKDALAIRKGEEALESTVNVLSTVKSALEGLPSYTTSFKELNKTIKSGDYTNLENLFKTLSDSNIQEDVSKISKKLKEGIIDQEAAAKTLRSVLIGEVKSMRDSVKGQETKLTLLEKQHRLEQERYGIATEEGELLFTRQKREDEMAAIRAFIKDTTKEQVSLEKLLEEINKNNKIYVEDGLEDQKEINKTLKERLKLEQQLSQEKLKGELAALKTAEALAGSGIEKEEIQNKIVEKQIEILRDFYYRELELIDASVTDTENATLKKQLAWEKYINGVNAAMSKFTIDQKKKEVEAVVEIDKEILKLKGDLFKSLAEMDEDNLKKKKEKDKEEVKAEKEQQEKVLEYTRIASQGLSRITTLAFNNRQAQREIEFDAINSWEEEKIRLAGDNEDAKLRIEEEAERKRRVIRRKQAKDNQKETIFQIAIDTAANVIQSILRNGGVPAGLPFGAVAAGLGLAQLALVKAQPLPQFAKGTDNSPEGLAEVGERGRELIRDGKTGKWALTPDKSTVTYLTKHSQVITNAETERILTQDHNSKADNYLSNSIKQLKPQQIDYSKIGQEVGKHISKIPVNVTNFDQDGVTKFVMGRSSKIKRLNKKY